MFGFRWSTSIFREIFGEILILNWFLNRNRIYITRRSALIQSAKFSFRLHQSISPKRNATAELKDWSILSLQESRLLLESKLLEENQVFISTGLGGLRGKLRYFIALFSESNNDFSDIQRNLIQSEFDYIFPKFEAEVEKVEFFTNYATIVGLIPLNIPVKDPIKSAIDECNNLGNFIKQGFLITNVKILSTLEIENLLNNVPPEDLFLKE